MILLCVPLFVLLLPSEEQPGGFIRIYLVLFLNNPKPLDLCVCVCYSAARMFVAQSHNDFFFFFGPSNLLIQLDEKQDVSLSE